MQDADDPTPHERDAAHEQRRQASFLQVVGAVFWSFFGVRKGTAMSRDVGTIKPLHVIIVGVVLAAMLVFALVAVVQWITHKA